MTCDRDSEVHQYCCRRVCHEIPVAWPRIPYIRCGECGHPYRTRWHLWVAYQRKHVRYWWLDWRSNRKGRLPDLGDVLGEHWYPTRWWHVFTGAWRPSSIGFCQCCHHDF